jgi:PAS domain S-box-containing protein
MRYQLKHIMGFFLGISFAILLLCSCQYEKPEKDLPKAEKGVIDLRNWDFQKNGAVKLIGEWDFYWGQHILPGGPEEPSTNAKSGHIEVPGVWNDFETNGKKVSGYGFASYRLRVIPDGKTQDLGLKILDMGTAFRVYVNGELLASAGNPGKTREQTSPSYFPMVTPFKTPSEIYDIIIHVSNFHYWIGGMWEPVLLGDSHELYLLRERYIIVSAVLFGAICIFGFYHLGLFWFRRNDKSTLYFGLFCLMMAIRVITHGERYIVTLFPAIGYDTLLILIFLSFYVGGPFFILYTQALFPEEMPSKIVNKVVITGAAFSSFVLLTDSRLFSRSLPFFQVFTIFILLLVSVSLFRAISKRRQGAVVFLSGFLIFLAAIVNDILYARMLISTGYLIPLGLLLFIFFQAFLISKRFSNAFTLVEKRGHELRKEIHDRQKAEQGLKGSEEKYRDLFENGSDLLCIHDLEGNLLETNVAHKKQYGVKNEDLNGRNLRDFLPGRYKPEFDEYLLRLIQNGEDGGFLRLVTKSGNEIVLEYRNRLIHDSNGKATAVHGSARDVSHRIKTEKALKESEEKYRLLIDHASDGIFITQDGLIKFSNQSALKFMGYTQEELAKIPYENLLHPVDRERVSNRQLRRIDYEEDIPSSSSFRVMNKAGDELVVDANAVRIEWEGRPAGLTFIRDITEQKRLESRLQRAQKMESIGTLAGGVAHDLNNILSGIVTYPDFLLTQLPENSPMKEPLEKIHTAGRKAAAIVEDLLTLARRGISTTEIVNLNETVSGYLESFEFKKLRSDHPLIHIDTQLADNLANIVGSPVHLSKTLMNLVANAAEAMSVGGVVSIKTYMETLDGQTDGQGALLKGKYVVIEVSDTGIGMSSGDMDKIFEPFYTKKAMGRSGSGLGMAVVWGTVKDHNGHITAKSDLGKGTTFTLCFPATDEARPEKKAPLSIHRYKGNGESILVVDDIEEQRIIASAILKQLGYDVSTASSGSEAISHMKNSKADLLVLDMIMGPDMDGLEAYLKIREIYPGQKAIMASGFSESGKMEAAMHAGISRYVKKPYTLEKLAMAVRTTLDA